MVCVLFVSMKRSAVIFSTLFFRSKTWRRSFIGHWTGF